MSKGLIIFDFDGTLGDTRRNIVTTMQMTIKPEAFPGVVATLSALKGQDYISYILGALGPIGSLPEQEPDYPHFIKQ